MHRLAFLNYQGSNRAGYALSAGAKLWPGAMGAYLSQPMEVILMFNKNGNCCPVAALGFNMMTLGNVSIHACIL